MSIDVNSVLISRKLGLLPFLNFNILLNYEMGNLYCKYIKYHKFKPVEVCCLTCVFSLMAAHVQVQVHVG